MTMIKYDCFEVRVLFLYFAVLDFLVFYGFRMEWMLIF